MEATTMATITLWHEKVALQCVLHREASSVTIGEQTHTITLIGWHAATHTASFLLDTTPHRFTRVQDTPQETSWYSHRFHKVITLQKQPPRPTLPSRAKTHRTPVLNITSPLAGRIIDILVAPGTPVDRDTPLIIIESMKMENEIRATETAFIQTISFSVNDMVEPGNVLMTLHRGDHDETTDPSHGEKAISHRGIGKSPEC